MTIAWVSRLVAGRGWCRGRAADHEGFASHSGHELRPFRLWSPRGCEFGEFADVVHLHFGPLLAELAPTREESTISSLAFAPGAVRGWLAVVEDRLLLPFQWDPAEPWTSGFLPLRSTLAWKQLRGPCGVSMVALYFRAIFVTVERCFAARVLSIEVSMAQSQPAQSADVAGEQVVLDEAPVLGPVGADDVVGHRGCISWGRCAGLPRLR